MFSDKQDNCRAVRYLLATEAFIGVLFSGCCAAILYAKITRIGGAAHVKFASSICLQYGQGVTKAKLNVQSVVAVRPRFHLDSLFAFVQSSTLTKHMFFVCF